MNNSEEPRAGLFFLGVFTVVLIAIVYGIVRYVQHVHLF